MKEHDAIQQFELNASQKRADQAGERFGNYIANKDDLVSKL